MRLGRNFGLRRRLSGGNNDPPGVTLAIYDQGQNLASYQYSGGLGSRLGKVEPPGRLWCLPDNSAAMPQLQTLRSFACKETVARANPHHNYLTECSMSSSQVAPFGVKRVTADGPESESVEKRDEEDHEARSV